ncbi:MAG: glycosyltransferase family 1 protein [Desulfobacteraceae bacterium]|nr:MAG: glycosyltransferase family 1 protein [Desulfobacteraceae bacterium]
MIRVLHIHTLPVVSGSGINTFLTMTGMQPAGFHSELACAPNGRLIDLVQNQGIAVHLFKNLVQPFHPIRDIWVLFQLKAFLKQNPFQIVHTHNSKAGFIGRLAAKWARVPVIVHTVHGFAFHDQEPFWRRWLFRRLERIAVAWCDKMIFISQPLIDWALAEKVVKPNHQAKVVKIYSGIDLKKFLPISDQRKNELRKTWGLKSDDLVIGMVSKLWEGKGHRTLIRAFQSVQRQIPNAKLMIVGEGYLDQKIKKWVQEYDLTESVIFTGFQLDVGPLMAILDVAVLPSAFEGMGRVLLEAMAMEKPVIASCVGGIPDLVEHGLQGLLVEPGKTEPLQAAMIKLLTDPVLARQMGRAGRQKVLSQFSAETMVQSIQKVYLELLKQKEISLED